MIRHAVPKTYIMLPLAKNYRLNICCLFTKREIFDDAMLNNVLDFCFLFILSENRSRVMPVARRLFPHFNVCSLKTESSSNAKFVVRRSQREHDNSRCSVLKTNICGIPNVISPNLFDQWAVLISHATSCSKISRSLKPRVKVVRLLFPRLGEFTRSQD